MADRVRTTVLVRVHDLETQTIFDRAKDGLDRSVWDVRRLTKGAESLPPPGEICPRVVLIGMADGEVARRLRAAGKTVRAIDNACHLFNDGSRSDGRAGASRIEQALAILGLSPSPDDRQSLEQIAANARGGIPRLVETICRQQPAAGREGVIASVLALREKATAVRACLLGERAPGEPWRADATARMDACAAIGAAIRLRVFATNRRLNDDPELILVRAPEHTRLVLEDAIYAHVWQGGGAPEKPLDILALYTGEAAPADPAPLVHIAFHGAAAHLPLFAEILAPATRRAWGTERLDARAVVTEHLCCRFADRLGTEGSALASLADRLLDHLLIGNRPLKAWRTSFLQPLRLADRKTFERRRRQLLDCARNPPSSRPKIMPVFAKDEERSYFLSHVRRHIVPTAKEVEDEEALDTALLSFRIKMRCLVLRITREDGAPERRLPICAQYVHLFAAGCLVVEWVVAEKTDEPLPPETAGREPRDEERRWHCYLQSAATARPTLIDLLDLNFLARFVYSGFIAEDPNKRAKVELLARDDHDKVLATLPLWSEVSKDQPFTGWFKALLKEGPEWLWAGIESAAPGNKDIPLSGKIAVFYADGNSFSRVQDAVLRGEIEDPRVSGPARMRQSGYDETFRDWRDLVFAAVVRRLAACKHGIAPKEEDKNEDKEKKRRLRLETLIWAGDDGTWVVPAFFGWTLASMFFAETLGLDPLLSRGWKFGGSYQLHHAAGLVFCHHDAPITRIHRLARDLAEHAKAIDRGRSLLAYQVLESFDHIGRDLDAFRRGRCPAGIRPEEMLIDGATMAGVPAAMTSITVAVCVGF